MKIPMTDPQALIRQLKIDLITGEPNPIIHWFENRIWNKLETTQCDLVHSNGSEIVYHTKQSVILYYDDTNKVYRINFQLWTRYIKNKYDINYTSHALIMQLLFEHYLNYSLPPLNRMHPKLRNKIEELLSL